MVNIGAAKEILTTVANGKFLNAINIAIKAINPNIHLKKCRPVSLCIIEIFDPISRHYKEIYNNTKKTSEK